MNDPNPSANVIGYQLLSSHQSKSQKPLPVTVGSLIFNEVEVLDVAGPFEVFSVIRLNEERRWIEPSPFRVLLLAEKIDTILAIGGLCLTPDVTLDNCAELDLLIVPGGWGTRKEIRNINLLNWIVKRATARHMEYPYPRHSRRRNNGT
ncbi:MAG TPA: hypothetical protein VE130_13790 [Nitrososphaeraceae archaeon]|nr:hypothetical protein [Nitrososphaeraceae archaeon]